MRTSFTLLSVVCLSTTLIACSDSGSSSRDPVVDDPSVVTTDAATGTTQDDVTDVGSNPDAGINTDPVTNPDDVAVSTPGAGVTADAGAGTTTDTGITTDTSTDTGAAQRQAQRQVHS